MEKIKKNHLENFQQAKQMQPALELDWLGIQKRLSITTINKNKNLEYQFLYTFIWIYIYTYIYIYIYIYACMYIRKPD